MTMEASAISFDSVGLKFGHEVIYESISFDIIPGEFVCILGPSGCGKSTALRLIGDLLPPSSGNVSVKGQSPSVGWNRLAFVFQSPRLLPWKTALQNAAFGLELRNPEISARGREDKAKQQLERVGLGKDGHKMPSMLSGGEKQRVSIARALALEPDIILMDEPFSALDPNTRLRLRQQIVDLWQDSGKTIAFVTHDIDEALFLADRIIMFSAKPAIVEHTIRVEAARPRDIETDPILRELRVQLFSKFEAAENNKREYDDELHT